MRISQQRAPVFGVHGVLFLLVSAFACLASSAADANEAPKISGTPPSSVHVKSWYTFLPTASDADDARRRLRFSVVNKPSWANFSVYSGRLNGSPPAAGKWSNIRITVTDGKASTSLPPFGIVAWTKSSSGGDDSGTNHAPTISGSPPTSATVATAYSFRPKASDSDGDTLGFSIRNRPAWASFSTSSGTLSGTPAAADIGTYSNIVISASDGHTSASLAPFAITVADAASAGGTATLSWTPPTSNTDGSSLTDLAGYRIYYGTSKDAMNKTIDVDNAGMATYVVENLSPATWYFSVRAYTSSGAESAPSNIATKVIE